jgi:hypothetical protein
MIRLEGCGSAHWWDLVAHCWGDVVIICVIWWPIGGMQ